MEKDNFDFDFKNTSSNNNSELNKLQLRKQGEKRYVAYLSGGKLSPEKLPLWAVMGKIVATLAIFGVTDPETLSIDYLTFVDTFLRTNYEQESRKPLPLDAEMLKLDTSEGWTYDNALKETLQLLFMDSAFRQAWSSGDPHKCSSIAEKIILIELPPNALLAIKKELDLLS